MYSWFCFQSIFALKGVQDSYFISLAKYFSKGFIKFFEKLLIIHILLLGNSFFPLFFLYSWSIIILVFFFSPSLFSLLKQISAIFCSCVDLYSIYIYITDKIFIFIVSRVNECLIRAVLMAETKKRRPFLCSCFSSAFLLFAVFFITSDVLVTDYKEVFFFKTSFIDEGFVKGVILFIIFLVLYREFWDGKRLTISLIQ